MAKIGTLNVGTRVYTERTAGPNGRKRVLTQVFVRMGNTVVADRVIPGKWDDAAALGEFKRFPERFKPRGTFNAATLKAIAA